MDQAEGAMKKRMPVARNNALPHSLATTGDCDEWAPCLRTAVATAVAPNVACRSLLTLSRPHRLLWLVDRQCPALRQALAYRGLIDDIKDPPDEWREMVDAHGATYFMNPLTGQHSWLSLDGAASILQRMVRRRQAADIGRPTMRQIVKAVRILRDAEEKFKAFPNRLSSIVNWAMILHTMHHDVEGARKLYKQAMEVPLLLLASHKKKTRDSLLNLVPCPPFIFIHRLPCAHVNALCLCA